MLSIGYADYEVFIVLYNQSAAFMYRCDESDGCINALHLNAFFKYLVHVLG